MDRNNQQYYTQQPYNSDSHADEQVTTRRRSKVWDFFLWLLIIALSLAVILRAFVVSRVTVSGESMTSAYYNTESTDHYRPELTYHDGDVVTVNKIKSPKRGDVVVFYKNPVKNKFLALFARGNSVEENGEYYKLIKRVVALGGDKIWVESTDDGNYRLVILTPAGEELHEDYYQKNGETLSADCFILYDRDNSGLGILMGTSKDNPITIEEGKFFAIGDNRTNSDDSRGALGQVAMAQLFGVVV